MGPDKTGIKVSTALPLLAAGVLSILVQTVLLREFLTASHGTEIALGFGLAAWLLGGAAGSLAAARLAGKNGGRMGLAAAFLGMATLALPDLILIRTFKSDAGYIPGQGISLGHMMLLALAAMAPLGACFGAAYSFGVRYLEKRGARSSAGAAYWLEAAGYLAGGLAFTFLLAAAAPAAVLMMLATSLAFLAGLTIADNKVVRCLTAAGVVLSVAAAVFLGPLIETWSLGNAYPGYRIEAASGSPYGQTVIASRQGQTVAFYDGYPAFHYPGTMSASLEEYAAIGTLHADRRKNVLLVGGTELLPVLLRLGWERVTYAELDPWFISAVRDHIEGAKDMIFSDPSLTLAGKDARKMIEEDPDQYDLIQLGVPYPTTLALNRYYTSEFFEAASLRLSPGGALAVRLPGAETAMDPSKARLSATVQRTMAAAFKSVIAVPGESNYLVGRNNGAVPDTAMSARLANLGSAGLTIPREQLEFRLDQVRRDRYYKHMVSLPSAGNADLRPEALSAGLGLWQSVYSRNWARAWETASRHWWIAWLGLAAAMLWPRMRQAGTAFTAGGAAMGLHMLCLWGVQLRSGALYHWMGLANALFMAGTALGAWGAVKGQWRAEKNIVYIDIAYFSWAAAFFLLHSALIPPGWLYLACSAVAGALLGLEFTALASFRGEKAGAGEVRAAGRVYAADMAGGFAAALLLGTLMIPAGGMVAAAALLVGLKAVSLRWWLARRGADA